MRGFRFAEFDALCAELSDEELQLKWQHYTRALTSASTSASVAVLAAGPTGGVSIVGAMIAGPLLHNARRKRQTVGRHMRARGLEPETRGRDVYVPLAIGGALGAATMGVGGAGAEALAADVLVDKTVAKVVLHTALDVGATAGEEGHLRHEHRKEQRRLAGALRPSRSFEVEGERLSRRPGESQQQQQQQQLGAPRLRHSRSFVEDAHSDLEYTMAGALGSSASVVDGDEWAHRLPEKPWDPQAQVPMSSPRAFMEKYPLISEYITSSDVSGRSGSNSAGVDASMLSGLFESFDEDTLAELERDLEQAVEEMDAACDPRPSNPLEGGAGLAPQQAGRTFEEPSDLDSLVRRHSVLYTSKAKRRSEVPSIFTDEAPPAYSAQDFSGRAEWTDRKPGNVRQGEDAGPSVSSEVDTMPPRYVDHIRHPSTVSSTSATSSSDRHPSLYSVSSVSTTPTSWGRPGYGRSMSEYSSATAESHLSGSSWTSRATSITTHQGPEKDDRDRPTSPRPASEYSQSGDSTAASESGLSTTSRASTIASRAGSVALSTHRGLAKTKYLGLETATKLAVGGSLCLVGVRPSVQRKMLDKAKGKISEARAARHVDDDYRDYA